MGRDSNIIIYVIGGIIILHFVVGILWLILKLGRKNNPD
jgi:heme/copper-type cytochrome/quinol oxidase subunit 4